jgi:hypothetical protein
MYNSTQLISTLLHNTASMSCLSALPDEILKLVMQHVSLKDRLASCCLVNRRLHAAAVAATEQLALYGSRWGTGLDWLCQYGQSVTQLHLSSSRDPARKLTCPNLRELLLISGGDFSVQLGPAVDGQPGLLQDCTKLTRLVLTCNVLDVPAGVGFDSLSRLVLLEDLFVILANRSHVVLSQGTLPSLSCLTHLTHVLISRQE